MPFISPLSLFPALNSQEILAKSYAQLRKRLLAEFELNNNEPLVINGHYLGKSEALTLLEALKDEKVAQQYLEINQDIELLNLLQGINFDYLLQNKNQEVKIPFIVQANFTEELNILIASFYKNEQIDHLKRALLFVSDLVIDLEFQNEINNKLYSLLKSDLIELNRIKGISYHSEKTTSLNLNTSLFSTVRAKCINAIGKNYAGLIAELCTVALRISIDIHKAKGDKRAPLKLCDYVLTLNPSNETYKIAIHNRRIIEKYGIIIEPITTKSVVLALMIPAVIFSALISFIYHANNKLEEKKKIEDNSNLSSLVDLVKGSIVETNTKTDSTSEYKLYGIVSMNQLREVMVHNPSKALKITNNTGKPLVIGLFSYQNKYYTNHSSDINSILQDLTVHPFLWYYLAKDTISEISFNKYDEQLIAITGETWKSRKKGLFYSINYKFGGITKDHLKTNDGVFLGETNVYGIQTADLKLKKGQYLYEVGTSN